MSESRSPLVIVAVLGGLGVLGVVALSDHRTFVVADIPGIIEGAHEGRGLGLQFLRHIERTRLLAFLIPMDAEDWQAEYDQLRHEIEQYSTELAAKPHCVIFTKHDLLGEEYIPDIQAPAAFGLFSISAAAPTSTSSPSSSRREGCGRGACSEGSGGADMVHFLS